MTKVLVVATSRKTRGGITSVIKAHETGEQWKKYHCRWIATHVDKSKTIKLFYAIKGFFLFLFYLPFYDILHFHVSFQGSLTRKYYMSRIARFFKKKIIVHFHPPTPEVLYEPTNYKKYKELFQTADIVIVLSKEWKKLLKQQFNIEKNVRILYNPCPKISIVSRDEEKSDDRYILFAGTLIERKGYQCLIRAFSLLAPDFPQWKLILAGNGELETAKNLICEFHLEKQIILKGWVNSKDMNILYQNASIFCLASSGEGFPMVVIEAWAHGIPIITTLVGGLPDIVVENENALTFEYNNENQLSQQIKRLIIDDNLRKKLSKAGLSLSQKTFNIEVINKQLEQIYKELSIS